MASVARILVEEIRHVDAIGPFYMPIPDLPLAELCRWRRRVGQAYAAWVRAGRLPADEAARKSEAVREDWRAFRERYLALKVIEGGDAGAAP